MSVLDLDKVVQHHQSISAGKTGTISAKDAEDTIKHNLKEFAAEVGRTRKGFNDERGNQVAGYDIDINTASKMFFGAELSEVLRGIGVYTKSDTVDQVAKKLGYSHISANALQTLMVEQTSNGIETLAEQNTDHRFLLPEMIMSAIKLGYQHNAMHTNWIAGVQPVRQLKKNPMPQLLRGDAVSARVNEGGQIPMGSMRFGQKYVDTFKIGTGIELTDELILSTSLDIFFLFMQEVGNDMRIGADSLAVDILINGEQANGSESAPVIGVDTAGSFTYRDIKRLFTRMSRLSQPATRIIAGEEDTIDITGIDKFEGFNGDTRLASIRSIVGVPDQFDMDVYPLPANQILFLAPDRAMIKLQFGGMKVERDRDITTQKEIMVITDYINFAIIKRDARALLTKADTIVNLPFPSYMDIDARLLETFDNLD